MVPEKSQGSYARRVQRRAKNFPGAKQDQKQKTIGKRGSGGVEKGKSSRHELLRPKLRRLLQQGPDVRAESNRQSGRCARL